ncbi:MAG: hydantoinase/oxoprolinase family protein, partial [Proteobacteria bacterium]|nr:hydantoinase/oxoprolinase family protein [Pseudomonadota bacterium]
AKVPTSVRDPSVGAITALEALCASAVCTLADVDYFMHGTTIATNIVLEHNGAKVGLITTAGFRDIIHIARHKRPLNFSLQLDLPWQKHPLVRRRHRLTVPERIAGPDGAVLTPLDETAVRAAVRALVADGIEAIAICFMFAFLNPAHEQRAAAIARDEAPDAFVCTSHEIIAQHREYERFSTACLNAFVGPRTVRYLRGFDTALKERGMRAELHLMQSSGGCATLQAATDRPVSLLMSGPVGGLLGGIWAGASAGVRNVISLDVGGTSADIGVAPDGQMQFKHLLNTRIGDYQAMVPMAEVDSIGAGGGSIAYVDAGGQFQVGPRSAGAEPGPCCYGRGGTEPTATDCQLVLGRVDPGGFLGGRMALDAALAERAVETKLARPLGMSPFEAALGAIRILSHAMVQAIEINSVRRGYDPRDFALVAFGGAGPLFACDIARELAIPTVVIPSLPGLTSALGLLASDVSYDVSRTLMTSLRAPDLARMAACYTELEGQLGEQLRRDGFDAADVAMMRFADCRYEGQGYELRAAAPAGAVDTGFATGLVDAFHAEHRRQYGSFFADKAVRLVNARVVGIGRIPALKPSRIAAGGAVPEAHALLGERTVVFEDGGRPRAVPTRRWRRDALKAGNRIDGPAIVEQMDTTTVIPTGLSARVDAYGNLVIEIA